MTNCHCQKKTIEKTIEHLQLIVILVATTAGIFFGLRGVGVGQNGAALASTSLVFLMYLRTL